MGEGWIKIHRTLLDWEWYSDVNTTRLFLHLLLTANHESKKYRGMVIERGQTTTSLGALAEQTNLSVRNVRTCLERLKTTGEVTIQTTSHYTLITICNYDSYQDEDNPNDKPNDKASDKQVTSNRQASDKQVTYNKNVRNNISTSSSSHACAYEGEQAFAEVRFYEVAELAEMLKGDSAYMDTIAMQTHARQEQINECFGYWLRECEVNGKGTATLTDARRHFLSYLRIWLRQAGNQPKRNDTLHFANEKQVNWNIQ